MKVRTLRRRFYRAMGNPRRCKDFDPECVNCLRFRFLDAVGRFPEYREICMEFARFDEVRIPVEGVWP